MYVFSSCTGRASFVRLPCTAFTSEYQHTASVIFQLLFVKINYQCVTQAYEYSLPITVFNTLPRPKLCIISSASLKVNLAHVFIKIIITDFRYLIMKRLIKTGFAFSCPNNVQPSLPGGVHLFMFQIFRRV